MDAQRQYRQVSREGAAVKNDFQSALKQVRINQLLEQELRKGDGIAQKATAMYRSSGKAFIITTKDQMLARLSTSDEAVAKEIIAIERRLQSLEQRQKALESSIKAIVSDHAIQ